MALDDDPRRNSPLIVKMSAALLTLAALEDDLADADWYPERLICAGLLLTLAKLVVDNSVPSTAAYAVALRAMRQRRRRRGKV